jgi:hypothetical protein
MADGKAFAVKVRLLQQQQAGVAAALASPHRLAFGQYLGFVHIDKPSGGVPDASAVQRAADLLKTKKKEARALHPLFARGLDTPLALKARPSRPALAGAFPPFCPQAAAPQCVPSGT